MFAARLGLGFLLLGGAAVAQQYVISTVAGGAPPPSPIPALSAPLLTDNGIATDVFGNAYIASFACVFRLGLDGMLTLVVGDCRPGYAGDGGPAANAQLFFAVDVAGMATDGSGNLFITDRFNYRIRKVTASGVITTVAGNGLSGFTGDGGPAISAQIENPRAVAVDTAGNLYIASQGHIRKVTTGGVITTLAAEGGEGIALDGQGNVYFSSQNYTIRKISANGSITTVAGTGTNGFSGDGGPAASAQISTVYGIAFDSAGSLYVSDNYNYRIRKISADGVITTVAGVGINGHSGDGGLATSAQISFSDGVSVDSGGNLLILDNGFVRRVSSTSGIITTVAGSSTATYPNGDGGPAISGRLASPLGVAVDSQGNLYIPESNRVRIVSNTGIITTFAGTGAFGFSGDGGPASKAQLANPNSVVVDSGGNLYITDAGNHRIRKVSRDGTITTVAGNGTIGSSGDGGPAISAQLNSPCALALDNAGNLYITDQNDNRIRKVTASGVIATLAGVGLAGYSGDNGPAASAQLSNPLGIALDTIGNLYIADRGNNRIRKVDTSGTITTVAGNGSVTFVLTDGGLATNASLNQPTGVAIDSAGNLFIADNYSRIRKVSPSGIIVTVAGIGGASGNVGYTGDGGPAVNAQLTTPNGLALGANGSIYVADTGNNAVRLLQQLGSLSVSAVTNGASNLAATAISPGEIVVLYGSGLGPSKLVSATVGSDGLYDKQLAGTTVSFNGIAAPMIYTWATQVSAVVPYGLTGTTAQVTVTYQGQTTTALSLPIASSAPGIFSLDSTGQGQAAAINQDGITINGAANPARVGDIISLYATGEGQTTPGGVDGKPATVPFPQPNLPVSVTIGGQRAQFLPYAGGAPGEVAGLMQINVQIPSGIQTGNAVPVVVKVGDASSQAGVTIAVH